MSLAKQFARREKVKLPSCEFCNMTAQYDFVDDQGEWRYGCTQHWMKFRASKQLGPGHAKHLTAGQEPPKRPEGYVPKPVDPTRLAKPQIAHSVQMDVSRPTPAGNGSASKAQTAGERREKRPKLSRDFQDMDAQGIDIKEPRPGSVLAITLDLMKNGGATLDEINAAIGPKHDALKLLQWAHENKGYGWKMDPTTKKIQAEYYKKGD